MISFDEFMARADERMGSARGIWEACRDLCMDEVCKNIGDAIKIAEKRSLYASMNQGTLAQVAAQERVRILEDALAYASGTAKGGAHFQALLIKYAREN